MFDKAGPLHDQLVPSGTTADGKSSGEPSAHAIFQQPRQPKLCRTGEPLENSVSDISIGSPTGCALLNLKVPMLSREVLRVLGSFVHRAGLVQGWPFLFNTAIPTAQARRTSTREPARASAGESTAIAGGACRGIGPNA